MLVAATTLQAQTAATDYNTQGSHAFQQRDFDGAIANFSKAIKADPLYAVAYNNRGNAKRAKGDLDGSLADFDRAIKLKPDFASAYNNRGLTKRFKGDLTGSVADFTKAIELDPQHKIGVINLANARKHRVPFPHDAKSIEDERIFTHLEEMNRAAVDALAQPPPQTGPDK